MANTKISAFTAETDVANITGFAAYKTAGGSSTNVRISGSEIESTLNLDNFAVGTLAVGRGGTGQTSYTDGQLLIGNTSTGLLSRATLTEGSNITITDGNGSITIASSLPLAANGTRGGIQIGYTENGKNYPLELNNEKAFVNVPWTDTTDNATGSAGELQYTNGSGVFQATPDMVYSTNQLKVQNTIYLDGDGTNAGIVKLGCESAGASHYVGLEGPTHEGANSYIIKFPDADPAVGKILKVNSFSSDKAVMEWANDTDTDTSIYAADGSLTGARTVTMDGNNLTFASTTAGQEVRFQQNVRIDGQSYTPLETISSTTSWTPDWDNGNVQTMELTGTTTINNPSNIEVGATYIIILKQDAEGSHTVTWGNAYNFPANTPPTLTTGANKADVITLVAYSSTVLMCTSVLDFETT